VMGSMYSTHGVREVPKTFLLENLKIRNHVIDLAVDAR
jgi:hypothetical protein